MGHYTFLTSSPFPRLPDASRGENKQLPEGLQPYLEAKNNLPLFWMMLFAPENIVIGTVRERFDPEENAEDLADFLEDQPEAIDAQYAYLATSVDDALKRAKARKEGCLAALGEKYRPIYEHFLDFIDSHYRPFVTLDTFGLPDSYYELDANIAMLTRQLEALESFEKGEEIDPAFAQDIQHLKSRQDSDICWILTGDTFSRDFPWPTKDLIAAFPDVDPSKYKPKQFTPPQTKKDWSQGWVSKVFEWGVYIVPAIVGVAVLLNGGGQVTALFAAFGTMAVLLFCMAYFGKWSAKK